jgi:hypothetical protein
MRLVRMIIIALATVGALAFASNALANSNTPQAKAAVLADTNHDLIPKGISKNNAKAAWARFNSRAFIDPNLRTRLAHDQNIVSYNPNDYRVVGYGKATSGTTNSSVLTGGQVANAPESSRCHVGARVLIAIHKVTGAVLEICTACGNPRLRQIVQRLPVKSWALGTVIRFSRHVHQLFKLPCLAKPGMLDVWVRGTSRERTWGNIQGSMTAQTKHAVDIMIKAQVIAKCKPVATPPPTPTANCPGGTFKDANGNCVAQTNSAEQNCKALGGTYNGSTQLCTIIQVNGNCSTIVVVNGSGNTVNTSTTGNCNNNPPAPAPTFVCTGLSLSASNLTATATVGVSTTGGATFKSATINWGDNNSTTNGLTQSHTYAAGGTFGVSAVVTFNLPNGTTASANCSASVTLSTTPPPVAHFTQIACQFPPHIIVGGSQFMYCVTTNDNGALISLNVVTNNESMLRASEQKSVNQRNQAGDPCPSGAQCFRLTLYAGSITGFATVTARATSNGVDATPSSVGTVEVAKDTGF